jgi:hypothetical protein
MVSILMALKGWAKFPMVPRELTHTKYTTIFVVSMLKSPQVQYLPDLLHFLISSTESIPHL